MAILNDFRYNAIGLFILFANINMYGKVNNLPKVDTIRITFTQVDGYATYRSMVSYAYQHDAYQLQTMTPAFPNIVKDLPNTINKECVRILLNDITQHSNKNQCDYINVTKDDYSDYIRTLYNRDSLIYYFPHLDFYPFSQDFKKEQYELAEEEFLSLSCTDIINFIRAPHRLFLANGLYSIKLELLSSERENITIEPLWFYEGTAWIVKSSVTEVFIGYDYIMSFLQDIQFDKYAFFWDKRILLFQLAESIVERKCFHQKQ